MIQVIKHALNLTVPQFRLDLNHSVHGIAHWARVWRNGREICESMNLNPRVVSMFAFLHDSQRFDDGIDIDHGPRAVTWLEKLFSERKIDIKASDFHLLCLAIDGHSFGQTEAHPIVQACWDSDRLDLGRCGIVPDPRYLCTSHAKKPDTIRRALNRSMGLAQST